MFLSFKTNHIFNYEGFTINYESFKIIKCSDQSGNPSYSIVHQDPPPYLPGTKAKAVCKESMDLRGSKDAICELDGTWTLEGDECSSKQRQYSSN